MYSDYNLIVIHIIVQSAYLVMAIKDKQYIYGDHRLIEYKLLELEPKKSNKTAKNS
jgi:hypothetical protein